MSIGSQLQQIDALAELTETIIALRAELADARAERLKLHAELNTTQRERDEAQALLERFVHGTTEEELRIHGLASSTALGDMEHRAEDAEAACAAYRDGLERFNGRRIGFGPSLEHRDLHAAQEYAQVLLERPNPGEGWLSPERAREVAEKAVVKAWTDGFVKWGGGQDGTPHHENVRRAASALVAEVLS